MKKITLIVVVLMGMIIGAAIGTNISRHFARQHEKTTAVMVLLQLHHKQWEQAAGSKNCAGADAQLRSLQFLANEISIALPLADQQDAVFHQHAKKMKDILATPAVIQCPVGTDSIKQVRDACDECHREYR